jgi:hypothetical protein
MSVFISQQMKSPPSEDTYKIGVPVFGQVLQSFGDRTNFLAYGKAKRVINTYFNCSHHQTWSDNTTIPYSNTDFGYMNKADIHKELLVSDTRDILFTCSPTARFIALQIYYESDNRDTYNDLAYIKAKVISSPRNTRTVIDAGWEANYANGFLTGEVIDRSTSHYQINPQKLSTGAVFIEPVGGSYISVTAPRPLFIPIANRNSEIAINFDLKYVRLKSVSLIEVEEGFAL